jgi:hypothetical protein
MTKNQYREPNRKYVAARNDEPESDLPAEPQHPAGTLKRRTRRKETKKALWQSRRRKDLG